MANISSTAHPQRRPGSRVYDWLIVGLLLTYVWRIQDLFPILATVKFPIMVSLLALGLFIMDGHAARSIGRYRNGIVLGCTFILAWMVLSVPGSVYPGLSLRFVVDDHVKTFLMMLLIISSIRTFRDVERLVITQVAGAALYCVMILTKFEVGMNGRLGNLAYYDANDLAMFIVCTLPLAVYFMRAGAKPLERLLALGCAAVFVLAIVKSGSRGGFLGIMAVGIYLVLAYRTIHARVRVGAVVGCTALLFIFAGPQYWEMMGTMLHPKDDDNWSGNNDVGRMAIWTRGVGYMKQRPIFGVGTNAFPVAEGTMSAIAERQQVGIGFKWSAAHNSFVQIGAELGFPGLLAFLFVLWRFLRGSWTIGRRRPGNGVDDGTGPLGQALVGTAIGYMVCGFFLSQGYSAYIYAMFGILVSMQIITRRDAGIARRRSGMPAGGKPVPPLRGGGTSRAGALGHV